MYKILGLKKTVFKAAVIILTGIMTIVFSTDVSKGIYKGICFCSQVLVPSIFPFMVISSITAKSNLKISGKILNRISKALFGISANILPAVIIGILGGYPVAARGIAALFNQGIITKEEARKASYAAVGAGPGFLITFVGIKLLHSYEIGIVLLSAQIISVFLLGMINNFVFRGSNYNSNIEYKIDKTTNIFIKSTSEAVHALIEMCALVCVFSAVISVVEKYTASEYIAVFLEVTTACFKLSRSADVFLIAFAVGFGGLCVHFQIFQALGNIGINKLLFFLYRIIQGIITAVTTYLSIKIFNITIPVFSGVQGDITLDLSGTVIGSVTLIVTGICFLYSIGGIDYVRNSGFNK